MRERYNFGAQVAIVSCDYEHCVDRQIIRATLEVRDILQHVLSYYDQNIQILTISGLWHVFHSYGTKLKLNSSTKRHLWKMATWKSMRYSVKSNRCYLLFYSHQSVQNLCNTADLLKASTFIFAMLFSYQLGYYSHLIFFVATLYTMVYLT